MTSEKIPKKRKKIIQRKIINNDNNNNNDDYNNDGNIIILDSDPTRQQILDIIRNKSINDIATNDDSKNKPPHKQMKTIDAAYRFLSTFGLPENEISKSWFDMKSNWRRLSSWRA